ncbi:MAG: hypothetical protein KatS3mg059_0385 [Thermomicrobiales bacterium]|nr:MAG: hypothetical protein KatS3mg059_0385 [Thermomicrobiales bacterium]
MAVPGGHKKPAGLLDLLLHALRHGGGMRLDFGIDQAPPRNHAAFGWRYLEHSGTIICED